jgi:hypothetical protein
MVTGREHRMIELFGQLRLGPALNRRARISYRVLWNAAGAS